MIVVIDTNILLSALIRDSLTRRCILLADILPVYPEPAIRELQKHKQLVLEKSGLMPGEFAVLARRLFQHIAVLPLLRILPCLEEAKAAMNHIDPADVVFLASALSLGKAPLWTEDRHFRQQSMVKVKTTREIAQLLTG